jgi:hypothetical protein
LSISLEASQLPTVLHAEKRLQPMLSFSSPSLLMKVLDNP